MKTKSQSINSIADLFRPNNPRGFKSRQLSYTRLNILRKEIQTNTHVIPLSEYTICKKTTNSWFIYNLL